MIEVKPLTLKEIYEHLFDTYMGNVLNKKYSLDKYRREANIYAVKHTARVWKNQFKDKK